MTRRRIVFFGNCQAQALAGFCGRYLAPRRNDIVSAVSWPVEDIDATRKELAAADIIVEQTFDRPLEIDPGGENRSQEIIRFPNVYAIYYWPYTNQRHPRNDEVGTGYNAGPYPNEMGDSFLNGLIAKRVSPELALSRYLAENLSARADRLFELNSEAQRKRDEIAGIDVQSTIERFFREEQLFLSSAHPTMRIFAVLATETMRRLGYQKSRVADALTAQRISPFPKMALPIHPQVIDHFGLRFATAETRYPYFEEGSFTFSEYVLRYMNFEWNAPLRTALAAAAGAEPASALEKINHAIVASPRSATAFRVKCELLVRMGDYDAAITAAAHAGELEPADPKNWLALSRAYRFARELDPAQQALTRAEDIAPVDADVRTEAAQVAAARGMLRTALAEAERAVEIEPGTSRFYISLSDFLARAGHHDQAIEAAKRIVELEPHIPAYRLTLADRLARNGQVEDAIAVIRDAISRGDAGAHAYVRLGHFLAQRDELDSAEQAFRRAFELEQNDPGIRLSLADLLDRKGASAEAVSILAPVVSTGTRDPHLHARLGHFLGRVGTLTEAEASMRRAVELAPANPHYRFALADLLTRSQQAEEAIAILRDLVVRGEASAHAHVRLGHLLAQRDELDSAEEVFRRAFELEQNDPGIRLSLADLLDRKGQSAEAASLIAPLISAGTRDAHLHARLGHFFGRLENLAEAEASLRRAVELAPDNPHYRLALDDMVKRKTRKAESARVIAASTELDCAGG